ncbi:MAG: Diguanylate cyclase protein [Frankiales bacterium]|nr:Diguanylate cyclase protein [Frankiales bacterium]
MSTVEGHPVAPGSALPVPEEPRETSGATTGLLLGHVRSRGGESAVAEVLRRAAVPYSAEELTDQSRWWSYDTRIRLFEAATEVLDDGDTMFEVGATAIHSGLAHSLVLLLRTLGTPRQVFRALPRAVAKFSSTSTMDMLEVSAGSATIRYRLHDGFAHSRLDCDYARGLLSTVPTVFGLPPARVVHEECESDGHPACIYHLTWQRRSRIPLRRRPGRAVDPELTALRGQLRILQSAASDLVGSDDLGTVLQRIVARAAEAVVAPAYVLAVDRPGGGTPLVHSVGLPSGQVPAIARTLLSGGHLGSEAVVVDVASSRRFHGRLAAVYRSGEGGVGDEASLLSAYAGHAAAALDLIFALEETRQEADRAGALLSLAHELAAAGDAAETCSVVAGALPRVINCSRASVMLWEPADGLLRTVASFGMTPEQTRRLMSAVLRPEDSPELVGMLTDREPRILRDQTSSPALRALLEGVGSAHVVAVPLLAGSTFLGVAAVGWTDGQAPESLDGDVLARLRGVGDQASTALQKARLMETVRHQATHDALTGLPNRALFVERMQAALQGTSADGHLAVLFCDLDRFKAVNDSLGHAAGDELLRQVAARLGSTVRPGDTVGRLAGDEFAVLLPDLERPEAAGSLAARVASCFEVPFRLEGEDVDVGVSIGLAQRSGPGGTVEELLREADAAMYRNKERGRTSSAG